MSVSISSQLLKEEMWRCVEERYLGLRDTMKIAKQNTGEGSNSPILYLLQPLFVEEVFAERNICGTLFESPAVFSGQVVFSLYAQIVILGCQSPHLYH